MPKLLSVNVGLPREIEWQDRLVRTAIWKSPAPHRVVARRLNLDGDGQADLGEHRGEQREVMVDQTEAIAIGNPISAGITSSADSSRRILPLTYNWRRGIRGDPAARYVLSGFE